MDFFTYHCLAVYWTVTNLDIKSYQFVYLNLIFLELKCSLTLKGKVLIDVLL